MLRSHFLYQGFFFMSFTGSTFNDRLKEQKEAKLAMLKRAKDKQLDPEQKAKLLEERAKRNEERAKREVEKEIARKAKLAKAAEEKAEKERKHKLAQEAAQKAKIEMERAAKARRDAKYAARKNKRR